MAKVRLVVGDTPSVEVDQLRRSMNALLLIIENVASQVSAGDVTAEEGFTALQAALSAGMDDDIEGVGGGSNNYVGTKVEVVGLRPMNRHPRWAGTATGTNLKPMEADDAQR